MRMLLSLRGKPSAADFSVLQCPGRVAFGFGLPRTIRIGFVCLAGLGVTAFFSGCSAPTDKTVAESGEGGTYRERLKDTAEEFAYYQLWEENLKDKRWHKGGISLRVPKPFQFVPTPVSPNFAQAHEASQRILGEPLPGVLGMWQAELPTTKSGVSKRAYLFLMSNQHFPPTRRNDALAFQQTLIEDVLAQLPGLNNKLPIDSEWKTTAVVGHGLPYTTGTFQATLPQTKDRANFTLYLMQYGQNARRDEIKVALLFIVPIEAQLAGSRPDVDPKTLSADTLRITPRPGDDS